MKPIQITLNGFMSFRNETTIPFSSSMTAVTGPNGHGKSSIILGIAWALFGQTRVDGDRDSVINDHENQAEVTLDFEDRMGQTWRIHRLKYWQGSQELTLQHYDDESGQWLTLGDHTLKASQQKIYELSGLDEDSFYTLMAIEQNSIAGGTRFTAADSNTRRTILMSLLPELGVYGSLEQEAVWHHGNLKDEYKKSETLTEDLERREASVRERIEVTKGSLEGAPDVDKLRKNIASNETQIKNLRSAIDAESSGRADLSARLEAIRSERRAAEAEVREERARLDRELKDVLNNNERVDTIEEQIEETKSRIEKARTDLGEMESNHAEALDVLKRDKAKLERITEDLEKVSSEVAGADAHLDSANASVEALRIQNDHSGEGKCLVCESELSHDRISELLLKAEQEQRTKKDLLDDLLESKSQLSAKVRSAKLSIDESDSQINKLELQIQRTKNNISNWTESLESLEADLEKAERVSKEQRSARAIRRELSEIKDPEVNADEERLSEELEALDRENPKVAEVRSLESENQSISRRIEQFISESTKLTESEAQLAEIVAERESINQKIGELEDDLEVAAFVRGACQQKGIPSMLISEILQTIEDRQNELLQRIMGDNAVTVEFRQERELKSRDGSKSVLDIIVRTADGFERPIESFSGGERVRLTMSNLIAMVQVFNERNPGMIRMLWLDEPFGALDTNSLPIMVEIIRDAVDKDIVESVYIVTHQAEVSEAMPQNMLVSKDMSIMSSVVELI